jgi:hypothetical protein
MPAPTTMNTANEFVSITDLTKVNTQNIYFFNIAPLDAQSNNGLVENSFQVQINAAPPSVSSMSHPDHTTWFASASPLFKWSPPAADRNTQGFYYLVDNLGTTVPTKADTFLPVTQKQQFVMNLTPSMVWVFHVVAVDQMGYLTKTAGNYAVRIGPDPGSGDLKGKITSAKDGSGISGATVSVNKGLFTTTTAADGTYDFVTAQTVPAGTWQLDVTATGFVSATKTGIQVMTGGVPTQTDFQLMPTM